MRTNTIFINATIWLLPTCISVAQTPSAIEYLPIERFDSDSPKLNQIERISFSSDGNFVLLSDKDFPHWNGGYLYHLPKDKYCEIDSESGIALRQQPGKRSFPQRNGSGPNDAFLTPKKKHSEFFGFLPLPPARSGSYRMLGVNQSGLILYSYLIQSQSKIMYALGFDGKMEQIVRLQLESKKRLSHLNQRIQFLQLSGHQASFSVERVDPKADRYFCVVNLKSQQVHVLKTVNGPLSSGGSGADLERSMVPGRTTPIAVFAYADGCLLVRKDAPDVVVPFPAEWDGTIAVRDWCFVNEDRWLMVVAESLEDLAVELRLFDANTGAEICSETIESPDGERIGMCILQNASNVPRRVCVRATASGNVFAINTSIGPYFYAVTETGLACTANPITNSQLDVLHRAKQWNLSPSGEAIAAVIRDKEKEFRAAMIKTSYFLKR
ncbi:hypothetical protein Enr13x_34510 [Stieleria neptunia]|uniref:WD40-like Beta Propeller Repeat protein n=1 Tax=Stieleria neptunia TaxID=2527979 RepID=A0A518HS00_9BACT|nr:hypothetical protein [Stieleria neptunia]QDV43594.1 hypothetical protein Enr13x_34510 [Stieleria neptunia]